MRMSAVEHALLTFQKAQINLNTSTCIDVGGTKKVYLELNKTKSTTWRRKLKNTILTAVGEQALLPKQTIITENPLLTAVPNLHFFDQGFNANRIDTESDIEADFLNSQHVLPIENSFDVVFCFDTLEHVRDPFTFCQNLVKVAKPGGYIYLQTVFSWEYHPSPQDYFRFSPDGLCECFANTTANIVECDWEVYEVSVFIFLQKLSSPIFS